MERPTDDRDLLEHAAAHVRDDVIQSQIGPEMVLDPLGVEHRQCVVVP
ncbi:MAG: hypothetical protein ACYC0B_02205 [Gemmatimonadaceae bacterium]